ncbi:MAG: hypothetical protein ABIR66_08055 [Saprospiraceae bacterium]
MKTKIKKNANQKFHFDALKSLVADYLKRNSTKSYTGRQLLKAVHANNDLDEMESALRRLIQTHRVFEKNGQFQYGKNSVARIESANTPRVGIEGRLEIIRSGAAYLISDQSAIDVYIPEKFLYGAIHGDIVKISINPSTKRKPEGKVVEIVRRETNFFVGTFYKRKTIAIVYPDSANHKFEIHISLSDSLDAKEGDKVIVTFSPGEMAHINIPKER